MSCGQSSQTKEQTDNEGLIGGAWGRAMGGALGEGVWRGCCIYRARQQECGGRRPSWKEQVPRRSGTTVSHIVIV